MAGAVRKQTFKAVTETDDFPAQFGSCTDGTVNDCIETGAIAATVQDTDTHKFVRGMVVLR